MSLKSPQLRRELGVVGATVMALGSIIGTGVFVSIGIAAGIAVPIRFFLIKKFIGAHQKLKLKFH